MAKKNFSARNKKKKKKPLKLIDDIPKCSQQRRSLPPKRRTDFSIFFVCGSSSSCNSGSLLESSCVKISLFNKPLDSLQDGNSEGKKLFPSSFVRCSRKSPDEGLRLFSNSSEALILKVDLVNQSDLLESRADREISNLTNEVLDYTPNKFHVAESKSLCVSPSSVTSAKPCEIWFPNEDLHQISSGELVKNSNAPLNNSDEQDLSSDKSTLSISSKMDDDSVERGRGKRERRPKVHFDEISISMPSKPDRQVRRLRIMRYLGLTPPIGSPF